MAAKRSWLDTSLIVANAAVWAAIVLIAGGLGHALRFGYAHVPAYLEGDLPTEEHSLWVIRAKELLARGEDLETARKLLEDSLAAEPVGDVHFFLGEVLRAQGKSAEALEHYEKSALLDPTRAQSYVRIAELTEAAGSPEKAVRSLMEGSAALQELLRRHAPVLDLSEDLKFNRKAIALQSELARGVAAVHEELRRRGKEPPPPAPEGSASGSCSSPAEGQDGL